MGILKSGDFFLSKKKELESAKFKLGKIACWCKRLGKKKGVKIALYTVTIPCEGAHLPPLTSPFVQIADMDIEVMTVTAVARRTMTVDRPMPA